MMSYRLGVRATSKPGEMTSRNLLDVLRVQQLRSLKGEVITPNDFMERWIPVLYGIYPSDPAWHTACVSELAAVLSASGILSLRTIRFWKLDKGGRGYPAYLPAVLTLLNNLYEIQESLQLLEKKELCVKLGDAPSWRRKVNV